VRLHKTLGEFRDIVDSSEVLRYDVAGANTRLKARIDLRDASQLFVREVVLDGRRMKCACHWQDRTGRLLVRWDNAECWSAVRTAPHHKNEGEVQASGPPMP